ncbi:hypothetical protein [Sphingomicrobium nitratireducens]|uniref:hypothetical protein n=1 Tax=Sphingomicrobium nitratireducens TaxID=2964666 RepID=UPI00223F0C1C|nr:hypothetical protein [Sphingomicrobium nitratireducens]
MIRNWLAGLALLALALVPSGFMPAIAHGQVVLIPCSGFVASSIDTAAAQDHAAMGHAMPSGEPADDEAKGTKTCAFAAVSGAAMLDPPIELAAFVTIEGERDTVAASHLAGQAALGLPPSTGPPSR